MASSSAKYKAAARLLFNLLIMGLAVWFLVRVISDAGLASVADRLGKADALLVALVIAANVIRYLLLALRWELLVRGEAPVGFVPIQEVLMAGNFVGLVTPVLRIAGPVLRVWYLSKETGRPRARFYGTIVADQTANFSIFTLGMIVSGAITGASSQTGLVWTTSAALLLALTGGLYVCWRHLRRLHRGEPSLVIEGLRRALKRRGGGGANRSGKQGLAERFIVWWEHMMEALSHAVIGRKTWWPAVAVSVTLFLFLAWAQSLAMSAVGHPIGLAKAAFAVSAASFVQLLAAAPGGVGVTEASLVGVLLALGVDKEAAVAGMLLARFGNYGVLIPWGGVAFWRLQRKYGAAPPPTESSGD